jgi:hypothetical protein
VSDRHECVSMNYLGLRRGRGFLDAAVAGAARFAPVAGAARFAPVAGAARVGPGLLSSLVGALLGQRAGTRAGTGRPRSVSL